MLSQNIQGIKMRFDLLQSNLIQSLQLKNLTQLQTNSSLTLLTRYIQNCPSTKKLPSLGLAELSYFQEHGSFTRYQYTFIEEAKE